MAVIDVFFPLRHSLTTNINRVSTSSSYIQLWGRYMTCDPHRKGSLDPKELVPFKENFAIYETQVRAIPENNSQAPLVGSSELKLSLDFFTLGACPVSHPMRP